jgi:hypothetical protein
MPDKISYPDTSKEFIREQAAQPFYFPFRSAATVPWAQNKQSKSFFMEQNQSTGRFSTLPCRECTCGCYLSTYQVNPKPDTKLNLLGSPSPNPSH